MERGKLDLKLKSPRFFLLSKTSKGSFEHVNTEDGLLIKRNVKHMGGMDGWMNWQGRGGVEELSQTVW